MLGEVNQLGIFFKSGKKHPVLFCPHYALMPQGPLGQGLSQLILHGSELFCAISRHGFEYIYVNEGVCLDANFRHFHICLNLSNV